MQLSGNCKKPRIVFHAFIRLAVICTLFQSMPELVAFLPAGAALFAGDLGVEHSHVEVWSGGRQVVQTYSGVN